ncbi:ClpXP protease specificity-enhancing factor [Xylophilus ampelinus]|uniref:Stringent starvation protein B n=1 Tax=Xylophilus ampelinus TaxID=54067 RepID=A0A318SUG6_9BURK|nr:ClpXP protease specificity-enhancing factor [Xylophilus ampelinus]MCS4510170.1 ClpXP protease specificity-enhancing factor [Xylophilus ampelinus]PYE78320.1 stringent starvation protein B [Xylophilus ampelinus]
MNALESTSTRPYLIRALYEWCTDNGFTPYVAVRVDEAVQVPREYVKNGEIVLNISYDATSSLQLGNDFIEFKARFAGTSRDIMVPISRVMAIYARENGQGMAFPIGVPEAGGLAQAAPEALDTGSPPAVSPGGEPRVMQLVAVDDTGAPPPSGSDDEPPCPPAGDGPRPSLKRVK